jgi:hypothetical protein
MSTTLTPPVRHSQPAAGASALRRACELLASEWTKLVSVRSTYWSLLVAAVVMLATAALSANNVVSTWSQLSPQDRASFEPISGAVDGMAVAQLVMAVLGVLAITGEYGTGMIRTSFTAVPQRHAVLAAKAAVLAALTLIFGELLTFASFFCYEAILSTKHIGASISYPGALRLVADSGLYLAVVALFGLGLGALLRRSAGALATVVAIQFLLPAILHKTLSPPWNDRIVNNTLFGAGIRITSPTQGVHAPTLPTAYLLCATYVAVTLLAATTLLTHRDT